MGQLGQPPISGKADPPSVISFTITYAPWFHVYRAGVRFCGDWFGLEPDPEKLRYWIDKATRIKPVKMTDDG